MTSDVTVTVSLETDFPKIIPSPFSSLFVKEYQQGICLSNC
uniref:Uncharacterized protein n=1 Tax=Anguilla anguilla TaxID=7936 RepID=A0A0E9WLH8_ANGAN